MRVRTEMDRGRTTWGGRRAGEIRVKGVEYVGEVESLKYITRDGWWKF